MNPSLLVKNITFTLLLLLFCQLSIAETADANLRKDGECVKNKDTKAMQQCLAHTYEMETNRLQKIYQQLSMKLPRIEHKSLKQSQQAWKDFSHKNCQFIAFKAKGTSLWSSLLSACQLRMTRDRIKELITQYEIYNR